MTQPLPSLGDVIQFGTTFLTRKEVLELVVCLTAIAQAETHDPTALELRQLANRILDQITIN
jgi:hypothetical protein